MVVNFQKVLKENKELKKKVDKKNSKDVKLIGKTSVNLPSHSVTGLIKQMGREQGALVREPNNEISNRSVMFNEEFRKEKSSNAGWLLR